MKLAVAHLHSACEYRSTFTFTYMTLLDSLHMFASLVRYSLLHFHLSHKAVHHHLHYHHFHLLLLVQSFILNLRLGFSANHFLHRLSPFLPDWFYGLSDHLMPLFCSTAGFVRLSRLYVGFWTHLKSLHFHRLSLLLVMCSVTAWHRS